MARLFVLLAVLNTAVPVGEVLELVSGERHHADAALDKDAPGQPGSHDEHGCAPTAHICRCCVSQPALVAARDRLARPHARAGARATPDERLPPAPATREPFRPPIG